MTKKFGLGILNGLGAGHDAIWASEFTQRPDIKLIAVADENEERGREFTNKFGADHFCSDYEELLKDEEVDIVQVSIENYKQASMGLKSIEAGKHTFVEKPTAISLEDSKRLVEAAKHANVKTTTGFAWRWDPSFRKVKELIDEGKIGKLCMAKFFLGGTFSPQTPYGKYHYDVKREGGGVFLELACHGADMLNWWLGEAESVHVLKNNVEFGFEGEDNAIGIIRYKSGAIAELSTSRSLRTPFFDVRAEVIGTKANARIDLAVKPSLLLYFGTPPSKESKEEEGGGGGSEGAVYPTIPGDSWPFTAGYKSLIENFIKSISEDKKPLVTVEDAYKALQIILLDKKLKTAD